MARFFKKRTEIKGVSPGTLVFIGQKKMDSVNIRLIDYNADDLKEETLSDLPSKTQLFHSERNSWLNIDGLHDTQFLQRFVDDFDVHPLIMEDVVNTGQRSKMEEIDEYIFLSLKMLHLDEEKQEVRAEQVSMVLHDHYLITFQERIGDVFEPVRVRLRSKKGKSRYAAPDYLMYALLDTVVDNYVFLIEEIGSKIEDLELKVLDNPDKEIVEDINNFKKELNFLSKVIRPAREMLISLVRSENTLIQKKTRPYINDLIGIITHAIETIDSYRTMLGDFLEIYNSTVNHRLNDVMRFLTVFSTIFIPLTFIAGIYGMNFEVMPELKVSWGYFAALGLMAAVAIGMLGFFRRKRWV